MKNLGMILATIATLTSNGAFAQTNKTSMGHGAQASTNYSMDNFAWGIGIGAVLVVGLVVGLAAGAGAQNGSNH